MQKSYSGTIVENLSPFLAADGEKILTTHNVSREKYLFWVYAQILRQTLWSAYLIIGLIGIFLTGAIFTYFVKNPSQANWPFELLIYTAFGPGLVLCIGFFTVRSITGKSQSSPLVKKMFLMGIVRYCMPLFLEKIPANTWLKIQNFQPDMAHYQTRLSPFKNQPEIPLEILKKIAVFPKLRKITGMLIFLSLILTIFGPKSTTSYCIATLLMSFGVFLCMEGLEAWWTKHIRTRMGGSINGVGAKIMGALLLFFGFFIFTIGFLGLFINAS